MGRIIPCQQKALQILNYRLKFKQFLPWMLQQRCILCAAVDGGTHGLCNACMQHLPWHHMPQCPQCALVSDGLLCGHCLHTAPYFDATHALFRYEYPLDRLLQRYKYQASLPLANTFASFFINTMTETASLKTVSLASTHKDLIIPMPMHQARLKERGFNQALEIARIISRHSGIKLDFTACQRTRPTPPQASLPLKERIHNMRGVFECRHDLGGLNILLVDDVMTSGASLNELAKTLKHAGAAHVECWVVARTLPQHA